MHLARALQLLGLALVALAPAAQARWRATELGNVTIYSQLSAKETKALVGDLVVMREAMRRSFPAAHEVMDLEFSQPLRIILPDNLETYKRLLPLYKGKFDPTDGIRSSGLLYDMIWSDARYNHDDNRRLLMRRVIREMLREEYWMPLSVEYGLAELYSGAAFEEGGLLIGRPGDDRTSQLHYETLMPPETLLTLRSVRNTLENPTAMRDFGDQSWLLMEFMLCGGANADLRDRFWLVMTTARFGAHEKQIAGALKVALPDLQQQIEAYRAAGRFECVRFKLADLGECPELKFRSVPGIEIDCVLAGAQVRAGRADEARTTLEALARRHPDDFHPWAELAELEAQQGNGDAALAAANKAVALGADPKVAATVKDWAGDAE